MLMKSWARAGLAGGLAVILGACAATGGGPADDRVAGESAPAHESRVADFLKQGFHADDVGRMAAIMAGDVAQTPQLMSRQGAVVRVDERAIRVSDAAMTLDQTAFMRQLQTELRRVSNSQVRYEAARLAGASSGRTSVGLSGGSSRGKGSGRGGRADPVAAQAVFHLSVAVEPLPVQEGAQVGAYRYTLSLAAEESRAVVWRGSYDLDAPIGPARQP